MDYKIPLIKRLNLETAPITWPELARFFARGRVLEVSAELDLLEVAVALAEDNLPQFTAWTASEAVRHLPDERAKRWADDDSKLWAVVIAPWVLVQERTQH